MKFFEEKKKYAAVAGLIAFGVVLAAVLINFGPVLGALKTLVGFFLPLIAGLVIAFILDVPARWLEKLLARFLPKAGENGRVRRISVVLTLVILAGVIVLIAVTVNPVVADSAKSAYRVIVEKLPSIREAFAKYRVLPADLDAWLGDFFSDGIPEDLTTNMQKAVSAAAGKAADTFSFLMTMAVGCIIAVYVLFDKERVLRHADKLVTASFSEKTAGQIRRISGMINDTYSRFLSGQCIEALILGVFMFIVLAVCRIPYAALIAVLAAVFSFIPYLGAFLAIAIGALLIFITVPEKLVLFFILYLGVQVIEEQFIYPHVVGNSVGLTPLLTLLSVIIGGSTFGLLGVLFFIPLMSVLYELVREWANGRIQRRAEQKKA